MPGLFGCVRLEPGPIDPQAARDLLAEMARRLAHLGTETVETFVDAEAGLALGRVRPGHLPAPPWPADESGSPGAAALLHGIFHGPEGPQGPAPGEVLSEVQRRGVEAFLGLRGCFSTVVHDRAGGALYLATDRRGSCPVVYAEHAGRLYFAPELKALLAVPGLPRELDPAAAGVFLASGFLLTHQTLLAGARRLEGGRALRVAGGRARKVTWADHRMSTAGDGTPAEALEDELVGTLRAAMARACGEPRTTLVFLSGGRDSRLLLGAALERAAEAGEPARAVSWTADDGPPGSDLAVARELAAAFDVDHTVLERTPDRFGWHLTRLGYVLDFNSDVAAFHGQELALMEHLAAAGFRRVLRGDQCFTYGIPALHTRNSLLRMCIRSASQPAGLAAVLRPEARERLVAASDTAVGELAAAWSTTHPDDVGDEVYFHHRLQGYLQPAAYFKQLFFDHRNPYLDEALLDLVVRIPVAERRGQAIFRRAAARAYPAVWDHPFAESHNLEDFSALLAADTPVRRYVAAQLAERDSPAWDVLDRAALERRLEAHAARPPGLARLKVRARRWLRDALLVVPPIQRRIRNRYLERADRPEELFLRAVLLKQWLELFLEAGAGRDAYERRLERAEPAS